MFRITKKEIISFIIGGLVFVVIGASAEAIISSKNISYSNSNTSATNVEDALNELYSKKSSCNYSSNYVVNYDYTGYGQSFVVGCSGYYKIEVWGAQGGSVNFNSKSYFGGYGAYSMGVGQFNVNQELYIYVGGSGISPSSTSSSYSGGFNGGGNSDPVNASDCYNGSGGGATHVSTKIGSISDLTNSRSDILIVASGGGGAGKLGRDAIEYGLGGSGGGIIGNSGTSVPNGGATYSTGTGGSQISAGYNNGISFSYGSFGHGGNGSSLTTSYAGGSGGGGGFYGGGTGNTNSGAGGGSGYIGNSLLVSSSTITKHMTCYNCQTSTDSSTMTNTTTNVSSTATADYAKSGNGYARITYLGTTLN